MFVTAIHAQGFRDLPDGRVDGLDRLVDLRGPDPSTTALGDALELAFAALSAECLERLLRRWGVLTDGEAPEITGTPFPDQASWSDQQTARALVADSQTPRLKVEVTLTLDPPALVFFFFGYVRLHLVLPTKFLLGIIALTLSDWAGYVYA